MLVSETWRHRHYNDVTTQSKICWRRSSIRLRMMVMVRKKNCTSVLLWTGVQWRSYAAFSSHHSPMRQPMIVLRSRKRKKCIQLFWQIKPYWTTFSFRYRDRRADRHSQFRDMRTSTQSYRSDHMNTELSFFCTYTRVRSKLICLCIKFIVGPCQ